MSELIWKDELKKINQCPQRQDSMVDQLSDLIDIATRFGFYDAADYLMVFSNKKTFYNELEDALASPKNVTTVSVGAFGKSYNQNQDRARHFLI